MWYNYVVPAIIGLVWFLLCHCGLSRYIGEDLRKCEQGDYKEKKIAGWIGILLLVSEIIGLALVVILMYAGVEYYWSAWKMLLAITMLVYFLTTFLYLGLVFGWLWLLNKIF